MQQFEIVGLDCGWDRYGVFHCTCGKCKRLDADVGKDRDNSGNNSSDGSYDSDHKRNDKPSLLCSFF